LLDPSVLTDANPSGVTGEGINKKLLIVGLLTSYLDDWISKTTM
jgi:hypothetical protein